MKKMLQKLPNTVFNRVHRSFTINLQAITEVRGKNILIGSITIPIGTTFEVDFFSNWGTN